MENTNDLVNSLKGYLPWNKAHITCFVKIILALFTVKTVNLSELALAFGGSVQVSSCYRRLQRFFALFVFDFDLIARWTFQLFTSMDQPIYLTMDRTNWFRGKAKINVFMLAFAHEGMAIPLFWSLLKKAGSSNFTEQKNLLSHFIRVFSSRCIQGLLADREFANGELFAWCIQHNIPFYIRIKEGALVRFHHKKFCTAQKLFQHLKSQAQSIYPMTIELFGQTLYLAGSRSERGELMIVATNRCPKNASAIYLRRWEIESLFQGLKSRGFRFEETHLTHLDRLAKLTAVLALAFAWAHKIGEWKAKDRPIMWKIFHRSGQRRPQYSYFRYGLDHLRAALLNATCSPKSLMNCFAMLFPVSWETL